jgi:hypothetical protein
MLKRYEFYKDGKVVAVEKAVGYFEALKKAGINDADVDDFISTPVEEDADQG